MRTEKCERPATDADDDRAIDPESTGSRKGHRVEAGTLHAAYSALQLGPKHEATRRSSCELDTGSLGSRLLKQNLTMSLLGSGAQR